MSRRPSSASTRSIMICRPIPARGPVGVEAGAFVTDGEDQADVVEVEAHDARCVPSVADHVLDRLQAAEVEAGLGVGVEPAARRTSRLALDRRRARPPCGCAPRAPARCPGRPAAAGRSRARGRAVPRGSRSASAPSAVEALLGGGRVAFGQRRGLRHRGAPMSMQPSLGPFADVALEPATLRVASRHQPLSRDPELRRLLGQLLERGSPARRSAGRCAGPAPPARARSSRRSLLAAA